MPDPAPALAAHHTAPGPLNPSRAKAEGRMAAVADGSLAAALRAQARAAADPNAAALAGGLADLAAGGLTSLAPALPLLLALRDEPFSLAQRPMYETLYRTVLVPPSEFLMFGRQTGKSTLQASRMILDAAVIHDFNALYLTPLFEMTRRFSSNYVGALLRDSPVRHLLVDPRASDSVLQKTFLSRANLFFSYASTDAERTRGLPIDCTYLDEVQNIRFDLISLITQTMGGSPWRRRRISGTPKSLANTAEAVWQATSQAEWFIKCRAGGCGHWNIPALEYDLLAMIGPWHRDISPKCPALLCGKCRKPVNTRAGRWVHRHPARKLQFAGHHLPQTVVPDTCESADAWATLTAAQKGAENMSHARFLNEVCAVSFDEASRLVTLTDVRKASVLPWPNALKPALAAARAAAGKYRLKVVSVDWGGGGGVPDPLLAAGRPRTSWTVMTVLGLDEAHAAVDVLYAHKSTQTHDPLFEARQAAYLFGTFGAEYLVHDFSNAGNQQEIFLRQAGVADGRILGFRYNPPQSREMMTYQKPTVEQPRGHYKLVKSTSLGFIAQALRMGFVRLPQSDLDDNTRPSPFRDLLALTEERVESRLGADYYVIGRDPNLSDDFAQALNIGAHALWFAWRAAGGAGWPDLALAAKFRYSDAQIEALDGAVDLAVFT